MASTKRRKLTKETMGKGPKKSQRLSFKATEAMRLFVERRADAEGVGYSELMRRAAELYKDLYEALGNDWHELERRAAVSSQSVGEALATIVRLAFEQEKKSKR